MKQSGISFAEAARYWLKLGFISFGGPTGQIAIMHRDLVEKKKWIAEDHFWQALNFCMLLPGPEAQQLATYIGWHLNGKWGGIAAGGLFVLPSIFILWALAWLYTSLGAVPMVTAVFYGLKPAVVAIVLEAVLLIGKKTLKTRYLDALAAAAFIGIYVFNVPFPVIVLFAGLIGYLFNIAPASNDAPATPPSPGDSPPSSGLDAHRTWQRSFKVLAVFLVLWMLPLVVIGLWRGWHDTFIEIGILFSKAGDSHFRGCVCRAGIHRPGGRGQLPMDHARADDGRSRPGREYARAAHHGQSVCRLPCGIITTPRGCPCRWL